MGCATGIVKYLVFIANLIFALAGLGLVVIGVLFKLKVSGVSDVIPPEFSYAPICSIVVGAIVFVTAFLGCCGAVKESPCMLTTYAIVLLTIFIVQVAIGVYAFLQIKDTQEFKNRERNVIRDIFGNYQKNYEAVDLIQGLAHCCGVDSPSSWNWENNTVPASCCHDRNRICTPHHYGIQPGASTAYQTGCTEAVFDLLMDSSKIIGGVVIGIAALEIIGAIFGLCLASSIRNHYRRNIYA